MADLPDGMLGAGGVRGALEAAESPGSGVVAQTTGGVVGDSPVRGTLVTDGAAGRSDVAGALAAIAGPGDADLGRAAVQRVEPQTSRALSRELKVYDSRDARIRRRADHIVSTALRGPEFDPSGKKPDNLSDKDWRIIRASYENMKSQPGWFTLAARIREGYQKIEAAKESAPTLNVTTVVVSADEVNFPVLKVER